MAVPHIPISSGVRNGAKLRNALDKFFSGLDELILCQQAMPGMVDMDANPDDYSHLEVEFGLPGGRGQLAKAELDALVYKLTTNEPVSALANNFRQVRNYFA